MRTPVVLASLVTAVLAAATGPPAPAVPARPPQAATVSTLPARGLELEAERLYTMHAGVRPLYIFWVRRDNVGSARFVWRRGPDGARGYEMVVGSDPARAPRKVNKWGYFAEESTAAGIAMLGVMKASDEETMAEAEQSVAAEGTSGVGFQYKAIRSDVRGGDGRTGVFRLTVDRDLTYRDLETLLAMIPAHAPAVRRYELPSGVRGGYLQTVAEILHASVQWHRSKGATPRIEGRPLRYIYNGGPYQLVLRSSKFVARAKFKGHTWTNLVEGDFRITNQTTGYQTDFRVDYGTQGELEEVPVRVVFQPRWWLEVELVLDAREP